MQFNTRSKYTESYNQYLFDQLISEPLIIQNYQLEKYHYCDQEEIRVQVSMKSNKISENYQAIRFQDIIILKPYGLNNQNTLAIRTEFAYLTMIRDKNNKKVGFQLQRNKISISILIDPQYPDTQRKNIIREWTRQLNQYVIRTDSLKKYCVLELIGQGSQAKVFKVTSKKQQSDKTLRKDVTQVFAVKIFDKMKLQTQANKNQLLNEIQNQRALKDCKQVIKIHKIYENEKFLNIIMEFAELGCLQKYIQDQPIAPTQSIFILTQLLQGIHCLNRKNIIHCDIKPLNILITKITDEGPLIKIADFGFSIRSDSIQGQKNSEICGTPGYFAPEVLRNYCYSNTTDIFSAGVTLYNMVTRRSLMRGSTPQKAIQMNSQFNKESLTSALGYVDEEFKFLLSSMLAINQRITAENALNLCQIKQTITHSKYLGDYHFKSKFGDDLSIMKDETRGVSSVDFIGSHLNLVNSGDDLDHYFLMIEGNKKIDKSQPQENIQIKLNDGENTKLHEVKIQIDSQFDLSELNSDSFDEQISSAFDLQDNYLYATRMEQINIVYSFRQLLQQQ